MTPGRDSVRPELSGPIGVTGDSTLALSGPFAPPAERNTTADSSENQEGMPRLSEKLRSGILTHMRITQAVAEASGEMTGLDKNYPWQYGKEVGHEKLQKTWEACLPVRKDYERGRRVQAFASLVSFALTEAAGSIRFPMLASAWLSLKMGQNIPSALATGPATGLGYKVYNSGTGRIADWAMARHPNTTKKVSERLPLVLEACAMLPGHETPAAIDKAQSIGNRNKQRVKKSVDGLHQGFTTLGSGLIPYILKAHTEGKEKSERLETIKRGSTNVGFAAGLFFCTSALLVAGLDKKYPATAELIQDKSNDTRYLIGAAFILAVAPHTKAIGMKARTKLGQLREKTAIAIEKRTIDRRLGKKYGQLALQLSSA